MPRFETPEFKFPDEINGQSTEADVREPIEVVIEDDTPADDRGREPMPEDIVKKLEDDDLSSYTTDQRERFKQLKKVWHDERRAKEAALREQSEAVTAAQRIAEENKRLKATIDAGRTEYAEALKKTAEIELAQARRAAREAYDLGDTDKILDSQEQIAKLTVQQERAAQNQQVPLQPTGNPVQQSQNYRPDAKALAWQERNQWFGKDDEMTASALGLHAKLQKSGVTLGSDAYYDELDKTMRRRFPESFGEPVREPQATPRKTATVVAPASRSTAPKRVSLRQSQVDLARKLGLTPEQYVAEVLKLESSNV